jgi:transporter family-2 protein
MNKGFAASFALLAGTLLPVQVAMNTSLGHHVGGPVAGALGSFIVGTLVLIPLALSARGGVTNWRGARNAPLWAWLSGIVGAVYVTLSILVTPVVGLTVGSAATITGQLSSALLVDAIGALGFVRRPITPAKAFGAVVMVVAVVMLLSGGSGLDPATLPFAALLIVAGAATTAGLGMSTTMRRHVGTPSGAALINFVVGGAALAALLATGVLGHAELGLLTSTPWWAWAGGLLGATYVVATVIISPRIGASLTVALSIAGQMLGSLAMDATGAFGLEPRPITLICVAGLVLLGAGVWAVQRHRPAAQLLEGHVERVPEADVT